MPRRKKEIEIKESNIDDPDAVDVLSLINKTINIKSRHSSPDSLISKLMNIEVEPSVLIYGPSKSGKSILAMWESTSLASTNGRNLMVIYTEPNIEVGDISILLNMCMYHFIKCKIVKMTDIVAIRRYIERLRKRVYIERKKIHENPELIENEPRVFLLDSITALSEAVNTTLTDGILSNPIGTISYQNQYQNIALSPLRELVSEDALSGFLITTAHETQNRGEPYNPIVTQVKSKPRYVSSGLYKEDAELYVVDNVFETLKTCKETSSTNWKGKQSIVVVKARREPDAVGRGLAFEFIKTEGTVKGHLHIEQKDNGTNIYEFIPEDMVKDENEIVKLKYNVFVPQIKCGPKKI